MSQSKEDQEKYAAICNEIVALSVQKINILKKIKKGKATHRQLQDIEKEIKKFELLKHSI